jgi:hypothetical protein
MEGVADNATPPRRGKMILQLDEIASSAKQREIG